MTTYYVATLARYVLVEAENEWEARERGYAALYEQYEDIRRRFGSGMPVEIRTIRPATVDEIEHMRWHQEYVAKGKRSRLATRDRGKPHIDLQAQAKTDWTPVSVPGNEKAHGPGTQVAWFAYNKATKQSIEFASFEEARDFCFHPDNYRPRPEPMIKVPNPGDRIRLVSMRDDPHPIEAGQIGTVTGVSRHGAGADAWHQIDVAWDNGRKLMLVSPPDAFEIIGHP